MTTLPHEEIEKIAEEVATENQIPFKGISTAAAIDSTGLPAVEVTISIAPGASFDFFRDGRSSRTVSTVIERLADKGEERLPIIHYEGGRAP
jgi:hypothetical protein